MIPTSILLEVSTVKAALASLVIVGRILLIVAAHRGRVDRSPNRPVGSAEQKQQPTSLAVVLTVAITAAQIAGAALTLVEWLHTRGLI